MRTLQWMGFAPIYDSGSSLGYDKVAAQIRSGQGIVCKPFKEQLELVSSFDWISFDRLKDVQEMADAVLRGESAGDFIDDNRRSAICEALGERIQRLENKKS